MIPVRATVYCLWIVPPVHDASCTGGAFFLTGRLLPGEFLPAIAPRVTSPTVALRPGLLRLDLLLPTYHGHVGRLQSLLALLDVELHALSFFQVPKAIALDLREMDKDISAFRPGYKPVALSSIEPLDGSSFSFRHVSPLKIVVRRKVSPVVA